MASIFGISDESFKKAVGVTFGDIVEAQSNKVMYQLRKSLQSKIKLTTSKQLEQSIIAMPVTFDGKTITSEIKAEAYWKFINKGVEGIGGTMKDGTPWRNKGTGSPFSFKNGKENKPSPFHFKQWAYLAGRSPFAVSETVWHSGIKANHFFDEVVNDSLSDSFAADLKEALSRTIEIDIKTDFDGK